MSHRCLAARVILGSLVAGILISAAACQTDRAPERFQVLFGPRQGVDPLTVTIIDDADVIRDVAVRDWELVADVPIDLGLDPAAPDTVILTWTGGMCDRATEIFVERANGGLRFKERTDRADACLLAGILRSLAFRLHDPAAAAVLELVSVP